MSKIRVAIVGLSFGLEFVPIYLKHPDVSSLVIVDSNKELLDKVGNAYGINPKDRLSDIQDAIDDSSIESITLFTPPVTHAPFSIRVLNAGKHCSCSIPMGMSMDELYGVIEARKKSGKSYMLLETAVFQRELFYVKDMIERGEFGRIQYMSCAHYQDMEGWPSYWEGFPPLMHPTHAVGPCLLLSGKFPKSVYGRGSGRIRDELVKQYNSPFAFESALITLKDSDITIELERFLYGVARGYSECFRIYGENRSFEWQQLHGENPVLYTRTFKMKKTSISQIDGKTSYRGSEILEERIEVPDYADRLPQEIAGFTKKTVYDKNNKHLSFEQGGGHGGSHPHMINEFVRSIIENRPPIIDDIMGAYWTGVGICAHQSAMEGGKIIDIPEFDKLK